MTRPAGEEAIDSAAGLCIGVLALQGDVQEHTAALADLGVGTHPVRRPADLEGLDGIVLPGGESTTLSMLLESSGLFDPLEEALHRGLPVFGTCAGLVLLATDLLDGRPDQRTFAVLDCTVRRNGYGRQLQSFEGRVRLEEPEVASVTVPAVFIRAPLVEATGPSVVILARLASEGQADELPVVVRQGSVLAAAFHPELTPDRTLHRWFVAMVSTATQAGGASPGPPGISGSDG